MRRELKRVPLDFDYPLGKAWYGYLIKPAVCFFDNKEILYTKQYDCCELCKKFAKTKGIPIKKGCPEYGDIIKNFMKQFEPPEGEGYQLWENTTEGSPKSPVFATLDELCEWCAENASEFGQDTITKEEWRKIFETDFPLRI